MYPPPLFPPSTSSVTASRYLSNNGASGTFLQPPPRSLLPRRPHPLLQDGAAGWNVLSLQRGTPASHHSSSQRLEDTTERDV